MTKIDVDNETATDNPDLLFAQLLELIEQLPVAVSELKKAYQFAKKKHQGQLRRSGVPYILHPVSVAILLTEMHTDQSSLIAALLHDTVEDTPVTIEEVAELFGTETAELVKGVTKITRYRAPEQSIHSPVENIRKMLLAMTRDIRVIFIKLADRLHNMRTLNHLPAEKQQRIARETLDIYAPLAARLGIGWIKNELEDLALKFLDSQAYYHLKKLVETTKEKRTAYINATIKQIRTALENEELDFIIQGRAKHFYSIYKKMQSKKKEFQDIYDLAAIRIITDTVAQCYQVLGVLHSLYNPLYDRFKDYIAMPKNNMYSSLHTTVIGPDGKLLEIQIRTAEMDLLAEAGAASHLLYKSTREERKQLGMKISWLQKLGKWKKSLHDPRAFMDEIKGDLLQDEIYVFTPDGDIKRLSRNATPVDFAYSIHTDVGNHCIGAKINGRMVPLRTTLSNLDIVEILTSRNAHPSGDWLKFVKSAKARAKIRSFLKNYVDTSRLFQESGSETNSVPHKDEKPPQRRSKNKPARHSSKVPVVTINGEQELLFDFAHCCEPSPGDPIIGFISRGRGIIIHRKDCPNLRELRKEPDRIVYPVWRTGNRSFKGKLTVRLPGDRYAVADLINAISAHNAGICAVSRSNGDNDQVTVTMELELQSEQQWTMAVNDLVNNFNQLTVIEQLLEDTD